MTMSSCLMKKIPLILQQHHRALNFFILKNIKKTSGRTKYLDVHAPIST